MLNWTHTFGTSFVNEVRFGTNYVLNTVGSTSGDIGNLNDVFNIPGVNDSVLIDQNLAGDGFAGPIGNPDVGNILWRYDHSI